MNNDFVDSLRKLSILPFVAHFYSLKGVDFIEHGVLITDWSCTIKQRHKVILDLQLKERLYKVNSYGA